MMIRKKSLLTVVPICAVTLLLLCFAACEPAPSNAVKSVDAGTSWVVAETTRLTELNIAEGGNIKAPEGYSVTLTVDGVETGIEPGAYTGDIVLTKTEANVVNFGESEMLSEDEKNAINFNRDLKHYFRQAIYLDETGVVAAKSVLPAAGDFSFKSGVLTGAEIESVGENFNGIYAAGGTCTVKDATINFSGNGGNDFAGYGAAVMAAGKATTLVVDGANINTRGMVRTALVADGGSNLVVKNSNIMSGNGITPESYVPNVSPGEMKEVPWMLGLVGNCRATNLLGLGTTATYINSSIAAEGWGVLSTDYCKNVKLTAINSKIAITGKSGYGAYALNSSVDSFYGCEIAVPDYGVIITGGRYVAETVFAASTPEALTRLNTDLKLGLTPEELEALPRARTTVTSGRFGVMWHGGGFVTVMDDTVFDCGKTIFLVKGASAGINVDGIGGARLNSGNGIILQVMDNDDPGDALHGVYTDPTEAPVKAEGFDITAAGDSDVVAAFANIDLKGDFYNAVAGGAGRMPPGGGMPEGSGPGPGNAPDGAMPGAMPDAMPEGGMPGGGASGKNMVLSFENVRITGIISASVARHAKAAIGAEDYLLLGEVANTPCPAVNNGVIVLLSDSTWTLTGVSYLSRLTIADGAAITAPEGHGVIMTVDGIVTPIEAGAYKGDIVLAIVRNS